MSKEILLVADAVSNEKGVDKEVIFQASRRPWPRQPRSAMAARSTRA